MLDDDRRAGSAGEHRDELPADLDASGYVGPYQFPDNSRRRIPGVIYLVIAAACVVVWVVGHDSSPIVNDGWLWAAGLLTVVAVISISSGWRMHVDERRRSSRPSRPWASPSATPRPSRSGVGCAAARRGACCATPSRTRPSARGLVLVDAIDGEVVEHMVEDNPERWSAAPPVADSP